MTDTPADLVRFVQARLKAAGDRAQVAPMQAYLKTQMPFYGVQRPAQVTIFREMARRFVPRNRRAYEAGVRALWALPHREEKYAAIDYAMAHRGLITAASLGLYERLVREGAWWDLVDTIAVVLVGQTLVNERPTVRRVIQRWIDDPDLWVRRTALLAHNRHKHKTDQKQLFSHCLRRAPEKEFFIRKAIGWALRQYSYSNPAAVRQFLRTHRDRLSPLSFREAARQLVRAGLAP